MRKILLNFLAILVFLLATPVYSTGKIADNSAAFIGSISNNKYIDRLIKKKLVINNILIKSQSPLTNSTDAFISACVIYNLDCYLLPSIAALESSFGIYVHPNSNNPFGWGGGYIMFPSWDNSIYTVASGLRNNYIDKGADTIDKIGDIYAESPTWAARVKKYINDFYKEEEKINAILNKNQVQL